MTDTQRMRAVFDVNVFVAAYKARNPASPTAELLRRWRTGEFDLVHSAELRRQIAGKLLEKEVSASLVEGLLSELVALGIEVEPTDVPRVITDDPDDDVVVACAVAGQATHLVTYDPHFDRLQGEYLGITILDGLRFLYTVRGDVPPESLPSERITV